MPAFMPSPRIFKSPAQVATRLGHGEEWFRQHRKNLETAGFPCRDDLLDGWDADAIDAWLDKRAGLRQHFNQDHDANPWDEVAGHG